MPVIKKEDHTFNVDIEKTKQYYKQNTLCSCSDCQNFYRQSKVKFPNLEKFLLDFGIDIARPDEISSIQSSNEIDYLFVGYTAIGNMIEFGKRAFDIRDNDQLLNIVIDSNTSFPNEQQDPYFSISVYGIRLPYENNKINFKATEQLIDTVSKFIPTERITIKSKGNKDWRGTEYTADYVEIIKEKPNRISFEVTEEEIILFFFSDHIHFEDYTLDLAPEDANYVDRAIEFLKKLFTLPIERRYTIKGDRVTRDESFFILPNQEKESCAGVTLSFAGLKNIFNNSIKHTEIKKFDSGIENFITSPL